MKKPLLYLSTAMCFTISFVSFGQAIENGDYEDIQNITRQHPNGDPFSYDSIGGYWVTGDEIKKDITLVPSPGDFAKDTSWSFSGNHAILMRTMDIGGIIGTGNMGVGVYEFDAVNPFNSVKIGAPYTGRPEKFRGHYAYESVLGDSCWVYVFFSKWNTTTNMRDTIGDGEFVTNQSTGFSAYNLMEFPINWINASQPDTMGILMVSSKAGYESFPPAGQPGSTFIVDSCSFIYDNSGLGENGQNFLSFQTQLDYINVQSGSQETYYAKVYDNAGKLVEAREIKAGENRFYLPTRHTVYHFMIEGKNEQITRKILF